jgi:hypothetical protein
MALLRRGPSLVAALLVFVLSTAVASAQYPSPGQYPTYPYSSSPYGYDPYGYNYGGYGSGYSYGGYGSGYPYGGNAGYPYSSYGGYPYGSYAGSPYSGYGGYPYGGYGGYPYGGSGYAPPPYGAPYGQMPYGAPYAPYSPYGAAGPYGMPYGAAPFNGTCGIAPPPLGAMVGYGQQPCAAASTTGGTFQVTASQASPTQVSLAWTAVPGATSYTVWQGINGAPLAMTTSAGTSTTTSVTRGTGAYVFQVHAIGPSGTDISVSNVTPPLAG